MMCVIILLQELKFFPLQVFTSFYNDDFIKNSRRVILLLNYVVFTDSSIAKFVCLTFAFWLKNNGKSHAFMYLTRWKWSQQKKVRAPIAVVILHIGH